MMRGTHAPRRDRQSTPWRERHQLVDDGPDPQLMDALSWRACRCGSWHYLAESCPDE